MDDYMELQGSVPSYRSGETVVTQDRSAWGHGRHTLNSRPAVFPSVEIV